MSNFSGGGVPEAQEKVGKLIKPGIVQGVISNVEYIESSQNKTKGIGLTIMTKPIPGLKDKDDKNGPDIGQIAKVTWWMSPKAWDNNGDIANAMWCTKSKLAVIADKIGCRQEYDNTEANSEEEFIKKIAVLFKGKKARWAFGGEEQSFKNDEGETITFVKPDLLTFKFVESLTEIPNDEDTKLVYDKNNQYHFKKAEIADDENEDSQTTEDEDIPW